MLSFMSFVWVPGGYKCCFYQLHLCVSANRSDCEPPNSLICCGSWVDGMGILIFDHGYFLVPFMACTLCTILCQFSTLYAWHDALWHCIAGSLPCDPNIILMRYLNGLLWFQQSFFADISDLNLQRAYGSHLSLLFRETTQSSLLCLLPYTLFFIFCWFEVDYVAFTGCGCVCGATVLV